MPQECWHTIIIHLPSNQQLSVTIGGIAFTSSHHSKPARGTSDLVLLATKLQFNILLVASRA